MKKSDYLENTHKLGRVNEQTVILSCTLTEGLGNRVHYFKFPLKKMQLGRDGKCSIFYRLHEQCSYSFSKSTNEVFKVKEVWHSPHMWRNKVHVQAFCIITWHPPSKWYPSPPPMEPHGSSVGCSIETITNTQNKIAFSIC